MWAEGEADEVQNYLDALAREMAGYIRELAIAVVDPGGLIGFQIRS